MTRGPHLHCPYDHDHPQPFHHAGRFVCGACFHFNRELVDMVPCTPDLCGDDEVDRVSE